MGPKETTDLMRRLAANHGFDYVGFAKAEKLEREAVLLERWLSDGFQGDMSWMENHFDLRVDPRQLMPGAKSVVSFMINYFPEETKAGDLPQIAKYAYGKDYHNVVRKTLKKWVRDLEEEIGGFASRICVDSAPIMERAWAERAGLGWVGKNAQLISRWSGSFFLLAEVVVDLELEYDAPIKDFCGTCRRCIDACPTGAIVEAGRVDSNKCISYLTIEYEKEIPGAFKEQFGNWAFGCDVCQDVCPWNKLSKPHSREAFKPKEGFLSMKEEDFLAMTEEAFDDYFAGSAIRRTKHKGMIRNVKFISASA